MKKTKQFKMLLVAALIIISGSVFAQVKIGDNPTTIRPTAVLEVESTTKAVYPPRVALTSANIAAPVTGLTTADIGATVYNIANAGSGVNAITQGLCTWSGTRWVCANGQQTISSAFSANKVLQNNPNIPNPSGPGTISQPEGQPTGTSPIKLLFTNESYDRGNEYDAVSTFTAQTQGVYQVNGCIAMSAFDPANPTAFGGKFITIYINGAPRLQILAANLAHNQGASGCGSGNFLLQPNDYVELYGQSSSGTLFVKQNSVFEVFKVSN